MDREKRETIISSRSWGKKRAWCFSGEPLQDPARHDAVGGYSVSELPNSFSHCGQGRLTTYIVASAPHSVQYVYSAVKRRGRFGKLRQCSRAWPVSRLTLAPELTQFLERDHHSLRQATNPVLAPANHAGRMATPAETDMGFGRAPAGRDWLAAHGGPPPVQE